MLLINQSRLLPGELAALPGNRRAMAGVVRGKPGETLRKPAERTPLDDAPKDSTAPAVRHTGAALMMRGALAWLIAITVLLLPAPARAQAPADRVLALSWNVWFGQASAATRYPAQMRWLHAQNPEWILLQEVTPVWLDNFWDSPLAESYQLTAGEAAQTGYGQAILTRQRPRRWQEVDLPSAMQRRVLLMQVTAPWGQDVVLINVHLESGQAERRERAQQIRVIQEQILPGFLAAGRDTAPLLWGGDFNVYDNESAGLPGGLAEPAAAQWIDAAQALQNRQPTYDPDANPLADRTAEWFEPAARLDRILLRGLTVLDYQVLRLPDGPLSDHEPIGAWIAPTP